MKKPAARPPTPGLSLDEEEQEQEEEGEEEKLVVPGLV